VAKRSVHHMDFETLVGVNKAVVGLSGETHSYSEADGKKLAALVKEVEQRADNQEFREAVSAKAALLVYDIARGQYFHAGNKRTALVAGLVFLLKNGYQLDVENPELVATVDRVGIAAADLDGLFGVMSGLTTEGKTGRKGWDGVVKAAVETHKKFLSDLAS
jgi:death-on-curing family protein